MKACRYWGLLTIVPITFCFPASGQEGRMPGYFPTTEEVDYLGGESHEMYGRHRGGMTIEGPDAGSLTASGLWRQDPNPTDDFYERNSWFYSPLDSTLGFLAPGEMFRYEKDEPQRSQFTGYADFGFPLTRDFNPDLATFKLGPLYLDLISLSGTVLYSDFSGDLPPEEDDGWLSVISLRLRGVAQLTDSLHLSLSGEIYYLPGENAVGFYLGNGGPSFFRIAYESHIGEWDYVIFDEFRAYHRLTHIFDAFEVDEIEKAGRYRFGRADDLRGSDFFDDEGLIFVNQLGAAITGPIGEIVRATGSYEHFDFWETMDFNHYRSRDRIVTRFDYAGEDWVIIPYAEYRLSGYDGWDIVDHTALVGARARITENLRAEAKAGYYKTRLSGNDVERPVYELGLIHELGDDTTHSLYGGAVHYFNESADNLYSTYIRYSLAHRFGSRLKAAGYVQYADIENLDGELTERESWSGGATLTGKFSDYTLGQLGIYYYDWDHTTNKHSDRERVVYRASIHQRLLPYLYAELLYQYEDVDAGGNGSYDEHLYMLTVTHQF